jgi:hypothetical protein
MHGVNKQKTRSSPGINQTLGNSGGIHIKVRGIIFANLKSLENNIPAKFRKSLRGTRDPMELGDYWPTGLCGPLLGEKEGAGFTS